MAGRNKRNSRKSRKARANGYHPVVVVRGPKARHLQKLVDKEESPQEIQLDPALTRTQYPLGNYIAATTAFLSSSAMAVIEFFKR